MKLTLIPVAPTGKRLVYGHIAHANKPHEWGPIEVDDYPPSPRGDVLRMLRLDHATLTRRQVCDALGIDPADSSALETGRLTLADDDWTAALSAVAALAAAEGR